MRRAHWILGALVFLVSGCGPDATQAPSRQTESRQPAELGRKVGEGEQCLVCGKLIRGGEVVELRNVTHIETGAAPSKITRMNRMRSVTVAANLENLTVAAAIAQVDELGAKILPEDVTITFSGSAEAFLESVRQFSLAIGLAVLVIYMVLAAQFESLLHPLTVMLAMPLSMVGWP